MAQSLTLPKTRRQTKHVEDSARGRLAKRKCKARESVSACPGDLYGSNMTRDSRSISDGNLNNRTAFRGIFITRHTISDFIGIVDRK